MIDESLRFEILPENSEYLISELRDRGFTSTKDWSSWVRGDLSVKIEDRQNTSFVIISGKGAREMAIKIGFNIENNLTK